MMLQRFKIKFFSKHPSFFCLLLSTFAVIFLSSTAAIAGVGGSLMQTAPVKAPGEIEAKAQADIIFNRGGGFNISPRISFGLIEHYFDAEAYIGTGTTNFFAGGVGKYNLLPDLEGQAGFSLLFGAAFLSDKPDNNNSDSINSLLLSFSVLVSKDLDTDLGRVTPYGSFQFEGLINSNDTQVPLTLIVGSRWQHSSAAPWNLYSEIAFNIHESFWGISIGAGYPFH